MRAALVVCAVILRLSPTAAPEVHLGWEPHVRISERVGGQLGR